MVFPLCDSSDVLWDYFSWESLITLVTLLWFLPSVCYLVSYKCTIRNKSIFTLVALIWFLPCVCPLMFYRNTFLWENLITKVALKPFLLRVCFPMIYKTNLHRQSLVTLLTIIWLLPCVFHRMIYKITFCWKAYHTLSPLLTNWWGFTFNTSIKASNTTFCNVMGMTKWHSTYIIHYIIKHNTAINPSFCRPGVSLIW